MDPNPRIQRWNDRFTELAATEMAVPDSLLGQAISGLGPGLVLDLACGAGRHAIALAERGFRVIAVDAARVGIQRMLERAQAAGCADAIEAHVGDLEADPPGFEVESGRYDLILDVHFLHRPLWPRLRDGVRVGGRFAAALHVTPAGVAAPHAYTLAPGELETTVREWGYRVLFSSESHEGAANDGPPRAAIIAERIR